jgi:hypothetical protein
MGWEYPNGTRRVLTDTILEEKKIDGEWLVQKRERLSLGPA